MNKYTNNITNKNIKLNNILLRSDDTEQSWSDYLVRNKTRKINSEKHKCEIKIIIILQIRIPTT